MNWKEIDEDKADSRAGLPPFSRRRGPLGGDPADAKPTCVKCGRIITGKTPEDLCDECRELDDDEG